MVPITKPYIFTGANNETLTLSDLFAGKDQLIVYHFMFGPSTENPCHGCTHVAESIPHVGHLRNKNTNLVMVSRAPFEKLDAYRQKNGWNVEWYSSGGTGREEFNFDFNATMDEDVKPVELNFRNQKELEEAGVTPWKGDIPGYSVFLKKDGQVYHTYSTWERGLEKTLPTLMLLDLTPLGRQVSANGPGDFRAGGRYDD